MSSVAGGGLLLFDCSVATTRGGVEDGGSKGEKGPICSVRVDVSNSGNAE